MNKLEVNLKRLDKNKKKLDKSKKKNVQKLNNKGQQKIPNVMSLSNLGTLKLKL